MHYRKRRRHALFTAVVTSLCLGLAGCGNGENPAQSATTLLAKARALAKGAGSDKPAAQPVAPSGSDGRFMAFESAESNVVEGDTNRVTDVFVFDRQAKRTARVSINSSGAQANGGSFLPQLSGDGRYVVFESLASNLVPRDTNGVIDVFVHDRQTQQTTRVSVASGGLQANNTSVNPTLSADGRYVTFESFATNLTPEQSDGQKQTFVHDRETGRTMRAPNQSAAGAAVGLPTPSLVPAEGG